MKEHTVTCPDPDCKTVFTIEDPEDGAPPIECPTCGEEWCFVEEDDGTIRLVDDDEAEELGLLEDADEGEEDDEFEDEDDTEEM